MQDARNIKGTARHVRQRGKSQMRRKISKIDSYDTEEVWSLHSRIECNISRERK